MFFNRVRSQETIDAPCKSPIAASKSSTAVRQSLYEDMSRDAQQRLLAKFLDTDPATTWGETQRYDADRIQLEKGRVDGSAWACLRVRTTVPADLSTIAAYLSPAVNVPSYDDMVDTCRVIETWTPAPCSELGITEVRYVKSKRVFPTQARDFVVVVSASRVSGMLVDASTDRLPDGSMVLVSTSVTHAEVPEKSGCVRGDLIVSGFVLVPLPDGSTDVTAIFHSDLKGYAPSTLVNALANSVPVNLMKSLRTRFEKT